MIQAIRGALRAQRDAVAHHPLAASSVALLGAALLFYGWETRKLLHVAGYLLATWLAALGIDVFCQRRPCGSTPLPVWRPKLEAALVAASSALGLIARALLQGVFSDGRPPTHLLRIVTLVLVALFVYPAALALAAFAARYTPSQLGLRVRGASAAMILIVVLAAAAWLFAPETIQWPAMLRQASAAELAFTGIVMAALPEEFWRMLAQTRWAAALGNNAWGWLLPSMIWSAFHWPATVWGFVAPLPIGLLWGYATHRTKSILPAVLAHGTNLWGLQDLRNL